MQMVLNGHIYRGLKPVHWSPSSGTALAEAELEYPAGHASKSVYVSLPVVAQPAGCDGALAAALEGAGIAVWTTTPWTMPANLAVGVNKDLEYSIVEVWLSHPTSALCSTSAPRQLQWARAGAWRMSSLTCHLPHAT